MATANPKTSPAETANRFCQALFNWLSGKLGIGKKELAQHLLDILYGDNSTPPTPARINQELSQRGIQIVLHYAITCKGPEVREDHLEDFISKLNKLKRHLPKQTGAQRGQSRSEEKLSCVETAEIT